MNCSSTEMTETRYPTLDGLLVAVRACRACEQQLPLGPRPILRASATASILIVGQAPGTKVHASGIPWDDASGEKLRAWMEMDKATFYDDTKVAIVPMGYCYPGRGNGGDNPPRRECADLWLDQLLAKMPQIRLTLLIGQYAQRHFLGKQRKSSLTETVRAWREYSPDYFPLAHPSPRNTPWQQHNPWFTSELLPDLRVQVAAALALHGEPSIPAQAHTL